MVQLTDVEIEVAAKAVSDTLNADNWRSVALLDEGNGNTLVTKDLKIGFQLRVDMPLSIRDKLTGRDVIQEWDIEDSFDENEIRVVLQTQLGIVLDEVSFDTKKELWQWTGEQYLLTAPADEALCPTSLSHVVPTKKTKRSKVVNEFFEIEIDEDSSKRLAKKIKATLMQDSEQAKVAIGVKRLFVRKRALERALDW